jgi:hypothetical protein
VGAAGKRARDRLDSVSLAVQAKLAFVRPGVWSLLSEQQGMALTGPVTAGARDTACAPSACPWHGATQVPFPHAARMPQ